MPDVRDERKRMKEKAEKRKKSELVSKLYGEWLEAKYLAESIPFTPLPGIKPLYDKMNLRYSSIVRINIMRLAMVTSISETDMYVTVFTLHDPAFDESVNLSYLYSVFMKKQGKSGDFVVLSGAFEHKKFCISPSLISCDGEYRRRFNNARSIGILPAKFPNEWNAVELAVRKKVEKKGWVVTENTYYPTEASKTVSNTLPESIRERDMTMFFLQATWLVNTIDHIRGVQENHINKKYQKIVLGDMKSDVAALKSIMSKFGGTIEVIYNVLTHVNANPNYPISYNLLEMGQKLVPLNIAEVQNPFDMAFKPWKEYLISNRMSSLVASGIACGFSVITKWLYIKNTSKGLFDNEIQYQRMEKGRMAKEIAQLLANARDRSILDPKIHQAATMIVDKFKHLKSLIQAPIDFCKEEIIMSNVALCIISEYVGKTFLDATVICGRSAYYRDQLGDPFGGGYDIFCRYMFELLYNLYCMNRYMGLIHGDLHLNNVAIRQKKISVGYNFADVKDPKILFVIDDMQFLMPTKDYNTCIIDFSRSSIHRDKMDLFKISYIEKSFKSMARAEQIDAVDRERLIRLYINLFPDSGEHKAAMEALFVNHYDETFKILSVLDVYNFCNKAHTLFHSGVKGVTKVTKKHKSLLKKLVTLSETILRTEMNKLMFDPQYHAVVADMELPILTIIKKAFSEFMVNPNEKYTGDLVDVFVARDVKLKILDTYAETPEMLRDLRAFDASPKHKKTIDGLNKTVKGSATNAEKKRIEALKMVAYISRRHAEKNML